MTYDLMFVLEQTRGNAVHGENVLRAAGDRPDVAARAVRLDYGEGDAIHRVPVLGNWSLLASTRARRAVVPALRQRPADALFVHTQCAALLLRGVARTVPTVVSMDATPVNFDTLGASYGHRVQGSAVERAKHRLTAAVLHRAAAVVTFSHWAGESAVRDYGLSPDRVRVIRPGVRLDRFGAAPDRPAGGKPRLLFVGGDFERKGGTDLLRAFARLGPVARLDVVTSRVPGDLPPGVRVHVGLDHGSPELFELYRRADVFVVPTRGEAYGLVYPEAMASGLPVVACDVGPVAELVVDGVTGLLVPPAAPDALAVALRTLVERPDLRREMGARGARLAHAEHDASRTCGEIVDLMRGLAQRRTEQPDGEQTRVAG